MSPVVEDTRHAGRRRPSFRPCWRRRRPWGSAGGAAAHDRRQPWATARAGGGRRYCRRRPGSSAGSRAGSLWRATAQATATASETAMAGAAAGWRRPRRPRRRETTPTPPTTTRRAAGRRLVGCRGGQLPGRRRAGTRGSGRRAARRTRAATRRRWRARATVTAWGCRGRERHRAGRAAWAARSAGSEDDYYDEDEDVEKDGGAGSSGRDRWRADRRKVEAGSKKKMKKMAGKAQRRGWWRKK